MAGIFDGALMDPRAAGLLSSAFAGLNASGPSSMPVSLGQVIGRAGAAGIGAYQDAAAQQLAQRRAEQAMELQRQQMGLMGAQTELARQNAIKQQEAMDLAKKRQETVSGILGRIGQPIDLAPTNENAAAPKIFTEQDALSAMRRAGLLPEAEQLVKAMPKLDTVNLGGQTKVVDLRATPAGTTFSETMKPGEAARLQWDQYQFGNLSANQRAQFANEAQRIGLDRTRTYFDTGMTGMGGGAPIGGVAPSLGTPMAAGQRPAMQPAVPSMTPKQISEVNAAVTKDNALKVADFARALPGAVSKAEDAVRQIDEMIGTAGKMVPKSQVKRPHPGFTDYVGATLFPGASYVDGTDAADFKKRLEQIKGGAFLQAFETLKGGGQITEIEGAKATAAITRMDKAQSEGEFIKAAREFQDIIRRGVERARKNAKGDFSVPDANAEWSVVR